MDSPKLRPLIDKQEIAHKVREAAVQIRGDYAGKDLVIVMVLKGALCLVADLIRELDMPLDIETVQCSSYGARGTQRGELKVIGTDRLHIRDKDVLIVDDIFDTGHTMTTLLDRLKELGPRSLKTCVLLNKTNVQKISDYRPDYVLFDIDNLFVVGYGLDFKERYRGLSGVYVLEAP
ncbi:MAG TPA: hypoxanthine phosphoribosyltransferase [Chlamydiales bacterium]|nr:hypoxanthine phosphoribosyltransferase [Chlamydiales bacterium]